MTPDRTDRASTIGVHLRSYAGFALLFSVFTNVLMLTGPIFMLQVYDRVLAARSEETLVVLLMLVVVLYLFMWILDAARGRVLSRLGARVRTVFERDIFCTGLTKKQSSEAVQPVERDLDAVQSVLGSPAASSVLDTLFTPFFLIAVFVFHPLLGWLALGGAPF